MTKSQSLITGCEAAYGVIIVAPEKADTTTEYGLELAVKATELSTGKVLAIGPIPKEYRSYNIGLGSRVVYSRAASNEIRLPVDGEVKVCRAVLWADIRLYFVPEKNASNESTMSKIKRWAYSWGGAIATGFVAGYLSYPLINLFSAAKYWVLRKFKKG